MINTTLGRVVWGTVCPGCCAAGRAATKVSAASATCSPPTNVHDERVITAASQVISTPSRSSPPSTPPIDQAAYPDDRDVERHTDEARDYGAANMAPETLIAEIAPPARRNCIKRELCDHQDRRQD